MADSPSFPTGLSKGEQGYSLQDDARYDIWNRYLRIRRWNFTLVDEKAKMAGWVKTKSALEALKEMFDLVDDISVKNNLYYHRKELKDFDKFYLNYFEPQLKIVVDYKKRRQEKMPVGRNGFSIYHYRRWKLLCKFFMEVSGISKFERPKEMNAELTNP